MGEETYSGKIKSDQTVIAIIEYIEENGPARIVDISSELEVSNGTVHKHLSTLSDMGYAYKSNGKYSLSMRFLEVGGSLRNRNPLCKEAEETINRLVQETDQLIAFSIKEMGIGYFTHVRNDRYGLSNLSPIGQAFPLHHNASGQAMLAKTEDSEVKRMYNDERLDAATPHTISSMDELYDKINIIRKNGYAVGIEERIERVGSISASIKDPETGQIGAISINGPIGKASKYKFEDQFSEVILRAADEISFQLGVNS